MTPAVRASALLLGVLVAAFVAAAAAVFHATGAVLRRREVRHARALAARHSAVGRHEADRVEPLLWTVSVIARWYRDEDGAPKSAVLLASLFLTFSVLIGATR